MRALSEIRDTRQLVVRFAASVAAVTLVLSLLLSRQRHWIEQQFWHFRAAALAYDLRSTLLRLASSARPVASAEPPFKWDAERTKVREILATIDSFAEASASDPRGKLYHLYASPDTGLKPKLNVLLPILEKPGIAGTATGDPLPYLSEIWASLSSFASASLFESEQLSRMLDWVQVVLFLFILVLFVGVGLWIIQPARRRLEDQDAAATLALQEAQARNNALSQSRQQLSQQTTLLQSVLRHMGVPFAHFDGEGRLARVSQAMSLRLPPFDLPIGSPGSSIPFRFREVEGEGGERTLAEWIESCLAGHPFTDRLIEIIGASDPSFFLANLHPVLDDAGSVEGAVLSLQDMTERVQSEKTIRDAVQAAEAASQAKTEFLANISHEIRTPMTSVLGYADLLLAPDATPESRTRHIRVIRHNAKALLTLINDLLDISKIEAGRQEVQRAVVPLADVVGEVHSLLSGRAQEKHIQFNVVFDGALPRSIYTDRVRLRQILINLVGNSMKFTERGEVRITVRHRRVGKVSRLQFLVTDTGCGIPEEAKGRLFTPFMQVDATRTRRYGGTGIGLALSQRLAKALGGSLRLVTSTLNVGSAFELEIDPGAIDDGELTRDLSPTKQTLDGALRLPEGGLEGLDILVAEDSPENRELVSYYLTRAGARVTAVEDGEAALRALASTTPHVILLDIQMPRLDGYQTVGLLRQRGFTLPIIALTAHAMEDERTRCLEAGFTDFVTKPLDAAELVGTCAALGRARGRLDEAPLLDEARLSTAPPPVLGVVRKFARSVGEVIADMNGRLDPFDRESAKGLAHRFRGSAASCGFRALADETAEFERELDETPDPEEARRRWAEVAELAERSAKVFESNFNKEVP